MMKKLMRLKSKMADETKKLDENQEVLEKSSNKEVEVKSDVKTESKSSKNDKKLSVENWGILYIYSSYNNTHLHVTDITGCETLVKVTGGMVTKSDRLKASPNVAMAAAKEIVEGCKKHQINALYVRLRGVGGHNGPANPGPGAQAAIRMITRNGIKLGRIEVVTPVPHDSCRKKGGKRGRRV